METRDAILEKQKEYCQFIIEVAKKPNFPKKIENINNLLTQYFQFCALYNLETYNSNLQSALNKLYIVESEPLLLEIEEEKVREALEHLHEVFLQNEKQLVDGITEEEAVTLLDFVVQRTRKIFIENFHEDIINNSLKGSCKMAQIISINLLKDMGLSAWGNDDTIFTCHETPSHYFGTVSIPIKENEYLSVANFLVDVSYRQFFTLGGCHEGLLNQISILSPDVGYYVTKTQEGRLMSYQLLKKGYMKLNKENAKLYGMGFAMKALKNSKEMQLEYYNKEASAYLELILNQKKLLEINTEQLLKLGYAMELPTKEKSL